MRTSLVRRLGVLFVALVMTAIAVIVQPQKALAVTEIKDDTDLAHVQAYQFTMTQANMSVISQSSDVDMDVIPPETGRQQSTVFALKVDKTKRADQSFSQPLKLKFSNAGTVNGKVVDVYVTVNNVNLEYLQEGTGDFENPSKTVVPFMMVDENWGKKSFYIQNYLDGNHPTYTKDMFHTFGVHADVTVELKNQDGTPCDLRAVMFPSDVDVISTHNRKESFSVFNKDTALDKIVMNNRNSLHVSTTGNKTTWTPTLAGGTSGDDAEHNVSGMAIRSVDNKINFEYGTTMSCGGLFGLYTEVVAPPPTKEVDKAEVQAEAGQELTYTTKYRMPKPGVDTIGPITSMSMVDTFDERLDFKSLTVTQDGKTLTEGEDYTVTVEGQKVTVDIAKKHLTKGNGGKYYTIVYKTVTNEKAAQQGAESITNIVTQNVDNIKTDSNKVVTDLLYAKDHEFVSGTPGKELPQEVLDLLPGKQTGIKNGTTVTPDPPIGGKTRVETSEGTWVFMGYDHDSETIDHKNAHFIGVWVIEPQPKKDVLDADGNTIDGNKVKAGQTLTYSVTYTNTTNTARDVTITDAIPEHTSYVDGSADNDGTYDEATHKVTWKKNVASGETLTVTFKVKVDKGVKDVNVVNTAHVSDGLIDTDTNTTTNPVPPKPHKSAVPYMGDNSMPQVLMTAAAGCAAVLLALGAKKYRTARG